MMILERMAEAYGIDYAQWRTLIRTSFRLANRQTSMQVKSANTKARDSKATLILSLVLYFILGMVMISFVVQIHDPFWSMLILYTTISFFVGSLMLTEFGAVIIAPEDYAIFSVQPVSSKTYFAAKSGFAIAFILMYTLALGLPSVVALGFIAPAGHGLFFILASFAGLLMVGIGASMTMILFYTAVLRSAHYRKLRSVLTYMQLVMTFFVYGSYTLLPSLIESISRILPQTKPWWVYVFPAAWYSMFLELARGVFSPETVLTSLAGIFFFAGILPAAFSKISMTYAESLAAAATVADEKKTEAQKSAKSGTMLKKPEERVVAALIRSQFKNDTKFRLGILAIIPLTIMYAYMGMQGRHRLFDPFAPNWHSLGSSAALYIAIILFPMMLKEAVTRSESFAAAWIFFVTPAEKTKLVISVKTILFWFFIVPYILLLGIIFLFNFQNALHVGMHLIILLLFSRGYLQLLLLINPNMPFSLPRNVGQRATAFGTVMVLGPIVLIGGLFAFSYFVYSNTIAYIAAVIVFLLIVSGMEKLLVSRISHKLATLEYQG